MHTKYTYEGIRFILVLFQFQKYFSLKKLSKVNELDNRKNVQLIVVNDVYNILTHTHTHK